LRGPVSAARGCIALVLRLRGAADLLHGPNMKRRQFNRLLCAGTLAASGVLPARAEDFEEPEDVHRALRTLHPTTLERGGGRINVAFAGEISASDRDRVLAWVTRSADALIAYLGRFSVAQAGILVVPNSGNRIGHGISWGYGGSIVRVDFGVGISPEVLANDWVLIHEMVHLSFPTIPRRHLWLEEGSATYVEPVARARSGQRPAQSVWDEFFHDMPKGLPQDDDQGLDRTHTWGRTYWGGAIFCLVADVHTRQATSNRLGLEDAMRAISRASGGNSAEWNIEQVIAAGDKASGTEVLAQTYRDMGLGRARPDLAALFRDLGVEADGDTVRLNDAAPLAAIRSAITARAS
jgi:hypothetical protein